MRSSTELYPIKIFDRVVRLSHLHGKDWDEIWNTEFKTKLNQMNLKAYFIKQNLKLNEQEFRKQTKFLRLGLRSFRSFIEFEKVLLGFLKTDAVNSLGFWSLLHFSLIKTLMPQVLEFLAYQEANLMNSSSNYWSRKRKENQNYFENMKESIAQNKKDVPKQNITEFILKDFDEWFLNIPIFHRKLLKDIISNEINFFQKNEANSFLSYYTYKHLIYGQDIPGFLNNPREYWDGNSLNQVVYKSAIEEGYLAELYLNRIKNYLKNDEADTDAFFEKFISSINKFDQGDGDQIIIDFTYTYWSLLSKLQSEEERKNYLKKFFDQIIPIQSIIRFVYFFQTENSKDPIAYEFKELRDQIKNDALIAFSEYLKKEYVLENMNIFDIGSENDSRYPRLTLLLLWYNLAIENPTLDLPSINQYIKKQCSIQKNWHVLIYDVARIAWNENLNSIPTDQIISKYSQYLTNFFASENDWRSIITIYGLPESIMNEDWAFWIKQSAIPRDNSLFVNLYQSE